jgi:hypothetical protein
MAQGWQPQGGVFIAVTGESVTNYQALILPEK